MSDLTKALAQEINEKVNRAIIPMSDYAAYGKYEYWVAVRAVVTNLNGGNGVGDCDDYTLTKRAVMIERGYDQSQCWVHFLWAPNGEAHMVLRVRINGQDWFLDNLLPQLASVSELIKLGYRFHSHIRSDGVGAWKQSIFE